MQLDHARKSFRFFDSLEPQEFENFIRFCAPRRLAKGDPLWLEGDRDNFAGFILTGNIGIKKRTEFGGRHVFVGTYGPGSVVGELCLLTKNPRAVAAESMEETELLILDSQKFEDLMVQHPLLGLSLLRHIFIATSARLTKSYERIASIF